MISILKAKLKNFMCIDEADLDFPENKSTMIVGENGSGKSAVLCSIGLAFDSYKKGASFSDYIKKNTNEAKVFIEAKIHNEPITFDITLSRKGTAFGRIITYKEKEYINTECDQLLETLEVTYFSKVIFSMQDEGDITLMKPAARADLLSKLLEYDFSTIVSKVSELIADLKNKVVDNNASIKLNTELSAEKTKEIAIVETLDFTNEDIKTYEEKQKSVELKIQAYDKISEDNSLINEEIETVRKSLEPLTKELETPTSIITRESEKLVGLKKDLESYESRKYSIEEEILKAESTILAKTIKSESVLASLDNSETAISEVEAKLTESRKIGTSYTVSYTQICSSIEKINSDIKFMEQGTCPTCSSTIDQSQVPALNSQKETLSKDKTEIISKQTLERDNQVKLDEILKDKQKIKSDIKGELTSLTDAIKTLNASISESKKKLVELVKPLEETLSACELLIKTNSDKKNAIQEKILAIQKQISLLETSRVTQERSEKVAFIVEKNSIIEKLKDFSKRMASILEVEQSNARLIKEIASCELKVVELKALNVLMNQEIEDNVEAKKVLDKDLPNYLIVKTCDKLEKRINRFVHSVFPDMTIKMYQDKKGVDFFYVPAGSYDADPENKESWINIAMSSGCEKAALSVGWRVALAESYGIDILMLDEVDSAATDKSSEKLLTTVLDSSKFSQVFIVTHRKETRDFLVNSKDIKVYYADHGEFSLDDPEDFE